MTKYECLGSCKGIPSNPDSANQSEPTVLIASLLSQRFTGSDRSETQRFCHWPRLML